MIVMEPGRVKLPGRVKVPRRVKVPGRVNVPGRVKVPMIVNFTIIHNVKEPGRLKVRVIGEGGRVRVRGGKHKKLVILKEGTRTCRCFHYVP